MKDATRISRSKKETQMRVNSKRERERQQEERERERNQYNLYSQDAQVSALAGTVRFLLQRTKLVVINYFKVPQVSEAVTVRCAELKPFILQRRTHFKHQSCSGITTSKLFKLARYTLHYTALNGSTVYRVSYYGASCDGMV